MRKLLDKISIALLSIFLFFLFCEILSAMLLPVLKINHGHVSLGIHGRYVLEYPTGYLKDRDLFWRLEPLCGDRNSVGFRDKELNKLKEQNTFRVICLGDSITFGFPTKITHTYPKTLEALLQKRFPGFKVEVFNFGVPGYTSYQGLRLLKMRVFDYDPDLVVVYYGVNDRSGTSVPDKEQPRLPCWAVDMENLLHRSAFYRLFTKVALRLKYPPEKDNTFAIHRVSPQEYRENLMSIMDTASARGVKSFFVFNAAFYDPEKRYVFCDEAYFPPERVPGFDVYAFLKKREKEGFSLFLDDIRPANFHLTEKGQDVLAEGVFEALIKSGIPIKPKD